MLFELLRLIWRSSMDKRELAERDALRRVRLLDAATNKVLWIPEADLPPGAVQVEMPGVGLVWMMAGLLNQGGTPAQPLPPDELAAVEEIKAALDGVCPRSLKEWEEELLRFVRPDVEVVRWLLVAHVFDLCTRGRGLSAEARRDYYNVVAASSLSLPGRVLEGVALSAITKGDAQEAVALYFNHRG